MVSRALVEGALQLPPLTVSAQCRIVWWSQSPPRAAHLASMRGVLGEVLGPVTDVFGCGLAGEVEQQGRQVTQVGQVCRWAGWVSQHGHAVAGKGRVDAPLRCQQSDGGGSRWDGRQVVLALLGGSLPNGVAAHGCCADAAEV